MCLRILLQAGEEELMAACLQLHTAAGNNAGSGKGARQLESAAFTREGLQWALLEHKAAVSPFQAAHFQVRWLLVLMMPQDVQDHTLL